MALFGRDTAVVSVGMSCQVAHQLRTHVDLVAELLAQPLEVHATPFDWTICGPRGTSQMLADGVTFPRDPAALIPLHKPYWPARGCWLWHAKGAIENHAQGLARALECEARLDQVRAMRRRVFILANTQNNLARQAKVVGGFKVAFTEGDIIRLRNALQARFDGHELYVVSHPGKHALAGWPGLFELKPDRSSWHGDNGQWRHLLAKIFSP